MAKIYRRSDRIRIKIDDVTITVAPLSTDQKMEAQDLMLRGRAKGDPKMLTEGIITLIRYGLKDVDGLVDADDNPYKLEFDGEALKPQCIDDLFNIEMHKKLIMVCSSLAGSIPTEFTDEAGKPIEGVEVLKTSTKETASPN
jgi:hypothetical protein